MQDALFLKLVAFTKFASLASALTWSALGVAASCCGGGSTQVPVLAHDVQSMFRFTAQGILTDRDATTQGVIVPRKPTSSTLIFPMQISAATLLSDRWQVGGAWRWTDRPGDAFILASYEWLGEGLYHPWRPRILPFFQITAPTGRSVFEISDGGFPSGQGFWVFNWGFLAEKDWGDWMLQITPQFALRAPRSGIEAGPVASVGIQLARRLGSWWVGAGVEPAYQGTRHVTRGSLDLVTPDQFQLLANVFATLEIFDAWRAGLQFQDGALFNLARNQALERILSFSLSHAFLR